MWNVKMYLLFSGAVLVAEHVKSAQPINIVCGKETSMKISSDLTLSCASSIIRHLARSSPSTNLYGGTILERTEVYICPLC